MEPEVSYNSLLKQLEDFPFPFNLEGVEKVTRHRLKTKKITILDELKMGEDCDEEKLRKMNFLTWIYFRLDKIEKAKELSEEISEFIAARNAQPNIPYLANRCVVMNRCGDETESKKCLKCLKLLRNQNDFPIVFVQAKAEQGYYYSRLGGLKNLKRTIDVLTYATEQIPNNYLWKFGLGLALGRITHASIFSSGESILDVDSFLKKAVEVLFEVAERGDNSLKSMAFAQLLVLRKKKRPPEMDNLFRKMDEFQLCDKALEHGRNNPVVLKVCGRIHDVDRSIELLERSVSLRPDTTAYHHLGLGYKRKAQQLAKRKDTSRSLSYLDSPPFEAARRIETMHDTSSHVTNVNSQLRNYLQQRNFNLPNESSSGPELSPQAASYVSDLFNSTSIGTTKRFSYPSAARYTSNKSLLRNSTGSESDKALHGPFMFSGHMQDIAPQRSQEYQSEINSDNWLPPGTFNHISSMTQFNESRSRGLAGNDQELYSPPVENELIESGIGNRTRSFDYPSRRKGWVPRSPRYGRNSRRYQKQMSNDFQRNNGDYFIKNLFGHDDSRRGRDLQSNMCASLDLVEPETRRDIFSQRPNMSSRRQTSGRAIRSQRSLSGNNRSPQEQGVKSYVHNTNTAVKLDKDDELVKKAKDCFTKAVELSVENFPAHLALAFLLKETGETELALTKFNNITKLENEFQTGNRLIIISAYEEAGLLYLRKSRESNDKDLENMGIQKLYKAVSLAADIPGLDNAQEFWCAFRTLEVDIRKETSPKEQTKQIIKLLELARKYRDILDSVELLISYSDEDFDDEYIIKTALKSFITTNEFEKAVAFHNVAARRDHPWWHSGPVFDLRIKILLKAALGRLTGAEGDYVHLFQQVFMLCFGCCQGEAQAGEDERGEQEAELKGDILVVFYDTEEEDRTSTSVRCLQLVTSRLFGLSVEENLKGSGFPNKTTEAIQLDEMKQYSVVILVLGDEVRHPTFEMMLWAVCGIKGPPRQRIVVMDTGLTNGQVPDCLRQYQCLRLSDIGIFADAQLDAESQVTHSDIIQRVFDSNFDAVLKLFSFIIGKSCDSS